MSMWGIPCRTQYTWEQVGMAKDGDMGGGDMGGGDMGGGRRRYGRAGNGARR